MNSTTEDNRLYSYTRYDELGRIREVGQVSNTVANGAISKVITRSDTALKRWLDVLDNRRSQITATYYDEAFTGFTNVPDPSLLMTQRNLRNRLSYTYYADTGSYSLYRQATFYTYDILGNVDTLLQDYGITLLLSFGNMIQEQVEDGTLTRNLSLGKVLML